VIYKEFLEIANEIIPNVIRLSCASSTGPAPPSPSSQPPLLSDPESYANLLRFYDGICKWEEGSSMPVVHIVWANHMGTSLAKFDIKAREKVDIEKSTFSVAADSGDGKRTSAEKNSPNPEDLESPESPMESPESPVECGVDLGGVQPLKLIPFDEESPSVTPRNGGGTRLVVPASSAPPLRVTRLGDAANADRLKLVLHSEKMIAMRELLVGDKLNLSAIKLLLTAQSQVYVKYSRTGPVTGAPVGAVGGGGAAAQGATPARKRQRRD